MLGLEEESFLERKEEKGKSKLLLSMKSIDYCRASIKDTIKVIGER